MLNYICGERFSLTVVPRVSAEPEHAECRALGQAMEVPDHNGVGYNRGAQSDAYRSRGQLQRHHTIQTCDDAYVSGQARAPPPLTPPILLRGGGPQKIGLNVLI